MSFESTLPTLYLYSRVSTDRQTMDGKTGVARQTESEYVQATLQRCQAMPVVYISDHGMSASKGHNIFKGQLGEFIKLCESGLIASGSVLAMENLDRFSRLALTESSMFLSTVLSADVEVYTWTDGTRYQKNNIASALQALIKLDSSNDYTNKLSERVIGAARVTLRRQQDGVKSEDGYSIAITGYGKNKFWVDTSSGFVRPHPIYHPIVKEIISMICQGVGHIKIKKFLDANYNPPTIPQNKNKEGWGINTIKTIIKDRSVLGEKKVTIDGREHILKDYYPPVCSEFDYARAKQVRSEKKQFVSSVKSAAGIITGMRIAKCGDCGSPLQVYRSKAGQKHEKLRYKCSGRSDSSAKSCTSATFDNRFFELSLILLIGSAIFQPRKLSDENKIASLTNKISNLTYKLELTAKTMDEITEDEAYLVIARRLDLLAKEKTVYQKELDEEMIFENVSIDPEIYKSIPHNFIDYTESSIRNEMRDTILKTVKSITVHSITGCFYIQVTLWNGTKTDGIVLRNKYIADFGFDEHHRNEDVGAFLAYNQLVNNFRCIDKDKNIISMIDVFNGEVISKVDCLHLIHQIEELSSKKTTQDMSGALERLHQYIYSCM
nr:recombinase family protein [Aeromonas rivipollensis]